MEFTESMAPMKLPLGLKAAQLKHAAFLMGLPSTGTKSELERMILKRLQAPSAISKRSRIVSIDMGVKNLGLCAIESPDTIKSATPPGDKIPRLRIVDWKKLNVLASLQSNQDPTLADGENTERANLNATAFTPSALSQTALILSEHILQTYNPTHILIERQRFRSGGAAAVQEWTLRVNMLESMIWACLTTMRATSKTGHDLAMHEVSPARVAKFWCLGAGTNVSRDLFNTETWEADSAMSRKETTKITKQDKIAVVKSWLESHDFQLSDQASATAESFLLATKGGRKPKHVDAKVDDLADCLLQGAAWVRWKENRQRMLELLR